MMKSILLICFACTTAHATEVSQKCVSALQSMLDQVQSGKKPEKNIPVECQYYRVNELTPELQKQLKVQTDGTIQDEKISKVMGTIITKKREQAETNSGGASGTVNDRMTVQEARDQNVITGEQSELIEKCKYTHIEAKFWYDKSRDPKFTGVVYKRREGSNNPNAWESNMIQSLKDCEKSKRLVHPNVNKVLDNALQGI